MCIRLAQLTYLLCCVLFSQASPHLVFNCTSQGRLQVLSRDCASRVGRGRWISRWVWCLLLSGVVVRRSAYVGKKYTQKLK